MMGSNEFMIYGYNQHYQHQHHDHIHVDGWVRACLGRLSQRQLLLAEYEALALCCTSC